MLQVSNLHASNGINRSSLFTGREDVLAAFRETLNRAQPGQLEVLAVNGPSGAGKTYLSTHLKKHIPLKGWLPVSLVFPAPLNVDFLSILEQLEKEVCVTAHPELAVGSSKQLFPYSAIHSYRVTCNDSKNMFDQQRASLLKSQGQAIENPVERYQLMAQLHERMLEWRKNLVMALLELYKEVTQPVCFLLDDYERLAETDLELAKWLLKDVFAELAMHTARKTVAIILGQIFPAEPILEDHTQRIEMRDFSIVEISAYLCKRYLLGVSADGNPVEASPALLEAFKEATGGRPLFLHLACTYLESFNISERTPARLIPNRPLPDDIARSRQLVEWVMRILLEPYRSLLHYGAVLRAFNKSTLQEKLKGKGIPLSDKQYEDFLYFFGTPIIETQENGLSRLHELIRSVYLEVLRRDRDHSEKLNQLQLASYSEWYFKSFTALQNYDIVDARRSVNQIKYLQSEGWDGMLAEHQITFLLIQGECLKLESRWTEAIAAFEQAIRQCWQLDYWQIAGAIFYDLGNIYYGQRELDKALESYWKALEIFAQLKDQAAIVILLSIANIYYERGKLEKVPESYFEAFYLLVDLRDQDIEDQLKKIIFDGVLDEVLKKYEGNLNALAQMQKMIDKNPVAGNLYADNIDPSQKSTKLLNRPGLRWALGIYKKEYHYQHYKQMMEFDRFKSLTQDVKRRIQPRVAQSISQIQAYQAWYAVINALIYFFQQISFVVGVLGALIVLSWPKTGLTFKWNISSIGALAFVGIYFLVNKFFLKERRSQWLTFF